MKILNTVQTREADAYTIANEPISSIDLMERASSQCVNWLINKYDSKTSFAVFCGVGNNGGDGLVIARQLVIKGYDIDVFIVQFSENYSADFKVNLERLREEGIFPIILTEQQKDVYINEDIIVVDAIFGSGLTKPITGWIAELIQQLNQNKTTKIAIDIPSGLFAESNIDNLQENIIQATYTLTFQQPKLAFLMPDNFLFVGDFEVLDIGLHRKYLDQVSSQMVYVTKEIAQSILHVRQKYTHKGTYGHALLIAGSKGKMGAAILAAKACLRSGAGLISVHIPKCGVEIMQTAVAEVMCIEDEENDFVSTLSEISLFSAVGIGPGLGQETQTKKVLKLLIQNSVNPLVIDADALNIIAENKTWLAFLPNQSILTPHPKEFERIVGGWANDEERLKLQQQLSLKNNLIVVLKGANTSITCPDGMVYFNSSGNPGMATGGTGDVLTGLVTGLLAQGYEPKDAAILGVYLHGVSGDIAKENLDENAMIAGDLLNYLAMAFGWLKE